MNDILQKLNADTKQNRLNALKEIKSQYEKGELKKPEVTKDTNNHVHTIYSFSPYSPTAAVYMAYLAGLCTVGIIDHDSISGAEEFIEAGKILGITTTIGAEMRVSFKNTSLKGKVLNNPDEDTVAYIALHGLPHNQINGLNDLLAKVRAKRNERNKQQIEKLNEVTKPYGLQIDFDADVAPISMTKEGGSITERHILFALTKKIIEKYGKGEKLITFLKTDLGIPIGEKLEKMLMDTAFEAYDYDVLNILKGFFVPKFFIAGGEDSFEVKEVLNYVRKLGVIPTYCYLGDVGESPTGDKKAQKFEDDYLEEVFSVAKELGFEAMAYMPSRNTKAQLQRVIDLCDKYGFMEISGEDINQPRQSFICEKLRDPMFAHLTDSTWALVGHENIATTDLEKSIYSDKTKKEYPNMKDRISAYKEIGLEYKGK